MAGSVFHTKKFRGWKGDRYQNLQKIEGGNWYRFWRFLLPDPGTADLGIDFSYFSGGVFLCWGEGGIQTTAKSCIFVAQKNVVILRRQTDRGQARQF